MGKQWKHWETILRGSNITVDGDCSHEIKRGLVLERKGMTNLDSLLKSREFAIFKGISPLFSIVAVLVCIPTNSVRGFPFLHTLSSIYCLQTFGLQTFWLVWSGTSLWFFFFFLNFLFFLNFKIFNSYMRSQTWTPFPPPSPQHLSGSSPCTSPKHAAPCVRHGLAIQFLHDSTNWQMHPLVLVWSRL